MRGFGANQAHFAMEGALDMLAEKVGLDRWEIRWRNALEAGDEWSCGQTLHASVGLKKTLLAVKDAWEKSGGRAGIACGIKNTGIGNGMKEWGARGSSWRRTAASRSSTASRRWGRAS